MARFHRLLAVLVLLQGAGHTFVGGPMFLDELNQEAIWFLAAGIGIMLLGIVNAALHLVAANWFRGAVIVANGLFMLLGLGLLTTSSSWQALLFAALTTGCFLVSAFARKREA